MAGIIVASTLVVGFGPPGYLLPKTCQVGKELGTYLTWTPTFLVNIPDGGSVSVWQNSWNYVIQSGSVNLTSPTEYTGGATAESWPPGSGIFVTFEETNWTIYATENVTPSGLTASPCTQPYVGDFGSPYGDCFAWPDLPLVNNSTDAMEPHSWNGTWGACPATTAGAYVLFNTTFVSSGSGYGAPAKLDLCGLTGTYTLAAYTPVRVPVTVKVPYGGKEIESQGYLTWQGVRSASNEATVTYNLPMGWNWEVSTIWPVGSPLDLNVTLNQLVAFERFAC